MLPRARAQRDGVLGSLRILPRVLCCGKGGGRADGTRGKWGQAPAALGSPELHRRPGRQWGGVSGPPGVPSEVVRAARTVGEGGGGEDPQVLVAL